MKLIMSNEVESHDRGANLLVYGPPDSGKTTLTATAPAPFLISVEGGTLSLKDVPLKKALGYLPDPFPTVEVASIGEADKVLDWCTGSKEAEQYATICVDSLSELAEVILQEEKAGTSNVLRAYGNMADEVMRFVRKLKNLPQHTYTTCKQYRERDEATNTTYYGPRFPGSQLPENLPYMFDVLMAYRLHETDNVVHRALMTKTDGCYAAKDRSGMLEPYEEPNLSAIIDKVMVTQKPRKPARKKRAKKPANAD